MTETIFVEMKSDLERLQYLMTAIASVSDFVMEEPVIQVDDNSKKMDDAIKSYVSKANSVNHTFRQAHSAIPLLRGALLLLVVSRFEAFIKDVIEELALQATQKSPDFVSLPKEMQENLLRMSGEVIANPRRYRMEHRVNEIAQNIANNLGKTGDITRINYFCLSLTTENMRPENLTIMFKKLGIKDYWERIAKFSKILIYFDTKNENDAKEKAKTKLNLLIDERNKVAHSPQNISWPSHSDIDEAIEFILVLAEATSDALPIFAMTFSHKP